MSASILNFPSISVVTPFDVPFIMIETPISGVPFVSTTTPDIPCCVTDDKTRFSDLFSPVMFPGMSKHPINPRHMFLFLFGNLNSFNPFISLSFKCLFAKVVNICKRSIFCLK